MNGSKGEILKLEQKEDGNGKGMIVVEGVMYENHAQRTFDCKSVSIEQHFVSVCKVKF